MQWVLQKDMISSIQNNLEALSNTNFQLKVDHDNPTKILIAEIYTHKIKSKL
jgi:hypothetical protein